MSHRFDDWMQPEATTDDVFRYQTRGDERETIWEQ